MHRSIVVPLLAAALGLTLFPRVATAQSQEPPPSTAATRPAVRGVDLSAMDKGADACGDFCQFACGGWRQANPVPPDRARWGRSDEVTERNQSVLRDTLETVARPDPAREPAAAQVGDFYASCMEEDAIERAGLDPIASLLSQVDGAASKVQLARVVGALRRDGIDVLFTLAVVPALADATRTVAEIDQGGLSLPDRGYYTRQDLRSVETRTRFVSHVAAMLELGGTPRERAEADAAQVLAVETALAEGHLDNVARRDPATRDHLMSAEALRKHVPAFDISGYVEATGLPSLDPVNVASPGALRVLDAVWRDTPLDTLRTFTRWRVLNAAASYLPSAFERASFEFFSGHLRGVKEMPPRWRRCVAATDRALGEVLGRLFVERTFGADGKARMRRLVDAVIAALSQELREIDWMTPATRARALDKLGLLDSRKVGYPDTWRDYSAIDVARGDYGGNCRRVAAADTRRAFEKLGRPVDRSEWLLSPASVNAYYHPQLAEIVFPAGILQPPFFDRGADDAVNYGAIGAVIGHELTHGFDDEGRKFDGRGNLADWWTPADAHGFESRAACFAKQYGQFSPVNDPASGAPVYLDPGLTMGENIADNGGVRIAYRALVETLASGARATIDGFTPEQRFFVGNARLYCQNLTDAEALRRVRVDPHAAARFRANAPLQNMPEFARAFGCAPGAPMAPRDRCRVW